MAFLEYVVRLFALDFQFFIALFMDNLIWVFAFLVIGHIMSKGKHMFIFGVLYASLPLFTMDLFSLLGFGIWTSSGLIALYTLRLALWSAMEKSKISRYIPVAFNLLFYFVIMIAMLEVI